MFRHLYGLGVAALALLCMSPVAPAVAPVKVKTRPKVEVVFCLDTTGSMTKLIDGAKAKIWAICNQIAGGSPTPDLKVGLVAYRDRGDKYVTQCHDLSSDLDAVHANLKTFKADGGGDVPESVNAALDDAVHKMKWSADKRTLKIIFLVGDAPPHMDYADDVKYPETCKKAITRDIIINTIQCGTHPECTKYWKDIALKSEGTYVGIPQDGGVQVVTTPFDKKLSELNTKLTDTVLVWGNRRQQMADTRKNEASKKLDAESASSRIAYQAKNSQAATYCLFDAIKQGKVKLEEVKKDELPEPLKKLNLKEQKEYLAKLEQTRAELNKQVLELDRKRTDYIKEKQAENKKKSSFDGQVLEALRKQAKKYNIGY